MNRYASEGTSKLLIGEFFCVLTSQSLSFRLQSSLVRLRERQTTLSFHGSHVQGRARVVGHWIALLMSTLLYFRAFPVAGVFFFVFRGRNVAVPVSVLVARLFVSSYSTRDNDTEYTPCETGLCGSHGFAYGEGSVAFLFFCSSLQ